jgi:hypothetical protein
LHPNPQQLRLTRFAVNQLNDGGVATQYRGKLEAELQGVLQPASKERKGKPCIITKNEELKDLFGDSTKLHSNF